MTEDTITVTYVYEKEKLPVTDTPISTDKPMKSPNTGADFSQKELNAIVIAAFLFVALILAAVYETAKIILIGRRNDENN